MTNKLHIEAGKRELATRAIYDRRREFTAWIGEERRKAKRRDLIANAKANRISALVYEAWTRNPAFRLVMWAGKEWQC